MLQYDFKGQECNLKERKYSSQAQEYSLLKRQYVYSHHNIKLSASQYCLLYPFANDYKRI